MHNAPSVSYPVGRSRFEDWLVWTVLLLGAMVCIRWLHQVNASVWLQGLATGVWLLAATVAIHNGRHAKKGVLRWDGQNWYVESGHDAVLSGRSLVSLDLQGYLLVAFRPEVGRTHWLWLDRGADTPRWDALRRALYAGADMQTSGLAPVDAGEMRS